MHPSKSPSPDGMSLCFFQKYWGTMGVDVCFVVCHFLETGEMINETNFTYIALIPKVKDLIDPIQLRPIALCNVVYKISSKVLANKLKVILPSIISPLQISAFVLDRMISDDTLVAFECHISCIIYEEKQRVS